MQSLVTQRVLSEIVHILLKHSNFLRRFSKSLFSHEQAVWHLFPQPLSCQYTSLQHGWKAKHSQKQSPNSTALTTSSQYGHQTVPEQVIWLNEAVLIYQIPQILLATCTAAWTFSQWQRNYPQLTVSYSELMSHWLWKAEGSFCFQE